MPNTTESETSILTASTLEQIAEKYMISSVPTHFFKGLRSLEMLSSETKDLPTQAILDRLDALLASLGSFAELMEAYGLIMAVSYENDLSVPTALRRYATHDKDWIGAISALANGSKVPLDEYGIPFAPVTWEVRKPDLGSSASTTEAQATGQSARQEEGG